MKIEASTVKAHQFGTVRRKGYDPIEVDRVMDRLVSTLQADLSPVGLVRITRTSCRLAVERKPPAS